MISVVQIPKDLDINFMCQYQNKKNLCFEQNNKIAGISACYVTR